MGVNRKPDPPLAFKGNGISHIDQRRNIARLVCVTFEIFFFFFFASWCIMVNLHVVHLPLPLPHSPDLPPGLATHSTGRHAAKVLLLLLFLPLPERRHMQSQVNTLICGRNLSHPPTGFSLSLPRSCSPLPFAPPPPSQPM